MPPRRDAPQPRRLFALDQNFPQPIVAALNKYIPEAEMVPLRSIDAAMSELDDWQIFLALHLHERPWDGLITNDGGMLNLPREVAVIRQTNLTLVIAQAAGHDPIKATGLLFTHLASICATTTPEEAQIWTLEVRKRWPSDPMTYLERIAEHQNRDAEQLWRESRLSPAELVEDPLAL